MTTLAARLLMPTCRPRQSRSSVFSRLLTVAAVCLLVGPVLTGLPAASAQLVAEPEDSAVGRSVVEVRVTGNRRVADTEILNVLRTEIGEPFNPQTVTEDYQRIFDLGSFTTVNARYEERPTGVIVVFQVTEKPPTGEVIFRGNSVFPDRALGELVVSEAGPVADTVLLGFARDSIERLYQSRNYALASVSVKRNPDGSVVYDITEGPKVLVRNIDFLGSETFTERELKRVIATRIYFPLSFFGYNGRYNEQVLDQDIGSLQQFYRDNGFFDVRVGRRTKWSPDLTEVQVEFLIDEGERYRIGEIEFQGNDAVEEPALRDAIERARLMEGDFYDASRVRAATRELVRTYSPLGFIYAPPPPGVPGDPSFLSFNTASRVRLEPGIVDLTINISEGRPFNIGRIKVRGNQFTKDKVILRQFDLAPGQLYNSDAVVRGNRRLQQKQFFSRVQVTPVLPDNFVPAGEGEIETRDLLVEVEEQSTALLTLSGAISSNGGLIGSLTYEQRNFDIADWPGSVGDVFRGEAFRGAGQNFRARIEPGTIRSNASLSFFEPYLYD
ncbi:MAG: POTRA domain-containing protein, partial [Planctomycetota bacterium]